MSTKRKNPKTKKRPLRRPRANDRRIRRLAADVALLERDIAEKKTLVDKQAALMDSMQRIIAGRAYREWDCDQVWEVVRGTPEFGGTRWLMMRLTEPGQNAVPDETSGPPGGRLVAFGFARVLVGPKT